MYGRQKTLSFENIKSLKKKEKTKMGKKRQKKIKEKTGKNEKKIIEKKTLRKY